MDIKAELSECFLHDWDGYGAEPISDEAVKYAARIYNYFGFKPSLGAEPDGMVTLEWYVNPGYLLHLSVDKLGNCYYVYMDEEINLKEHGQFNISDLDFLTKFRILNQNFTKPQTLI